MEYQTKDFYLSACLVASGTPLHRIEKIDYKTSCFIFNISESKAEEIFNLHWQRKLTLPTRDIIEAINELKTRMYERS
jgi:hypothetical protein